MEYSVLIVDDDIWMQRILSKTLQSYGFNNIYLASNGFEGISIAVERQPSLIILDILMPELSGHLTLKILKHIKLTKKIPVVMVSALSDTENLGLAVKSGTAGFISKPFTRATVFEKLIAIFGKDTLDQIQKGESPLEAPAKPENANPEKIKDEGNIKRGNTENDDLESLEKTSILKSKTAKGNLLKHYQEDEKRSIESIKKLLLKTRK